MRVDQHLSGHRSVFIFDDEATKVHLAHGVGRKLVDIAIAIHTKRHTWRQAEPILPWLLTIARYKVVDAYRRKGSRVFIDIDDVAELLPSPDATSAEATDRHLERALSGLSDGQQRVVRSIGVHGRSISETASELGMKETAVRVAFHRGLAAIATKFGRQT
jgi:RNA polymerase sigma-70 factor (ECF subfamily)